MPKKEQIQKAKKDAKKAAKKAAEYAEKNPLGVLKVAGVVAAIYLLYKTTTGIKKAFTIEDNPDASDIQLGQGDSQFIPGGTITHGQAKTIATILLDAMDYYGTEEQKIFDALRGKNLADFRAISQYFGTPRYDGIGRQEYFFPKRNLTYWLSEELSSDELNTLKSLMPGVLA